MRVVCECRIGMRRWTTYPWSFISESGRPAAEAVVAAPMRKLCDEYRRSLIPVLAASLLMQFVSVALHRRLPEDHTNSGEECER